MNNRGQVTIGMFLVTFISVLVGVILLTASAQQIGFTKDTITITNETITLPDLNEKLALNGSGSVGTPVIYTNGTVLQAAGQFVYTNRDVLNSQLTFTINNTNTSIGGYAANISYEAQPDGDLNSSGADSMMTIVILLMAIGVAIVALSPTMRSKVVEMTR